MGRTSKALCRAQSLDLQKDRLSIAYRSRLEAAGERFRRWCALRGAALDELAAQPKQLVPVLVAYLQALFDEGVAFWWALHAVLFVQTEWRTLRGQVGQAWDSVATWRMHLPVTSRIPLRKEILRALCYAAVVHGCVLDPGRGGFWLCMSAVLRLGFHGLLRPKEIFELKAADVLVPRPGTHSMLQCCVATIREPKNRSLGGRIQVRMVRDPAALAWISWRLADAAGSELVWPFGPEQFSRGLRKLLAYTQLGAVGITPSSLRAGGATALLEEGSSISHIMFAGGWTSEKTLSAYLQLAEAAQTLLKLDRPQAIWLQAFIEQLNFLEAPPQAPYISRLAPWTPTAPSSSSRRPRSSSSRSI